MPEHEARPRGHDAIRTRTDRIPLGAMTRRDKLTPQSLQAEIEELFSELWHVPRFAGLRRGFRPNVDSYRTDDPPELTVSSRCPGSTRRASTIVVSERTLVDLRRAARASAPTAASTSRWRSSTARSSARSGSSEDVDPDERARPATSTGS